MNAPLKADVTAADRLLKAAVRRARDEFAAVHRHTRYEQGAGFAKWTWRASTEPSELARAQTRVERMLTAAGESADLLLSEPTARPAKAAKRAPRKAS
jgi:hypothetical protein